VAGAGETAKVVPVPVSIEDGDGSFGITPTTQVLAAGGARTEASKLIDSLAPALGFRLKLVDRTSDLENSILLELESPRKELLGEEGYELEVTARSIVIRAVKPAGLFYGIQTLRQLLPAAIFDKRGLAESSGPCLACG
jgi:hexosaminidase